jgi:hypothetical protein
MARVYEAAVTKTTGAAAGPIANPIAGTRRASILEIGFFATTAVAGEVGLGRSAGTAVGALTGTLVQAGDTSDEAGTTTLTTSFATTQPTAPTNFTRRIQLPATIGAGIIWTWAPGELIIPATSPLVNPFTIWQISSAAVTYDVYVKVLE